MRDLNERVRASGAVLAVIGNGSVEEAADFARAHLGDEVRLLTDPGLNSYQAMALRRSLWANANPRTYWRGLFARRRGFRQGSTAGDTLQQGGAFVITPDGEVPFSHYARSPDDRADADTIVAVLYERQQRGRVG